jgi:NAD-specific glutamate dehydrogenase
MWVAIEDLDNKVDDLVQAQMLIDTSQQLERGTVWFLRSRRLADDMAGTIAYFKPAPEMSRPGSRRESYVSCWPAHDGARAKAAARRQ